MADGMMDEWMAGWLWLAEWWSGWMDWMSGWVDVLVMGG